MNLQSHSLTSACGRYTRRTWFQPRCAEQAHPLYLFLDAEYYLERMDALQVIERLFAERSIPEGAVLLVSHLDNAARHRDYPCNESYAEFIAKDVLNWARSHDPWLQANGHTVCGLSLSGLASAFLALRFPWLFSRALSQSGSFWWLADHEVTLEKTHCRFWLSVGDQETSSGVSHPPSGMFQSISQIAGVELTARRFTELGGTVNFQIYQGGHDPNCWKAELGIALMWLTGEDQGNLR